MSTNATPQTAHGPLQAVGSALAVAVVTAACAYALAHALFVDSASSAATQSSAQRAALTRGALGGGHAVAPHLKHWQAPKVPHVARPQAVANVIAAAPTTTTVPAAPAAAPAPAPAPTYTDDGNAHDE
jgi:hypothetical protein